MTTTDERHELGKSAAAVGWERSDLGRVDVFRRGTGADRIRVVWRGSEAISGAVLYQDDIMTTYTRELATVDAWLKR